MRILVTNDDGIESQGIKSLRSIAEQLSSDIWVVAPENEQSGKSHSISLIEPLRIREIDKKTFCVSGTPSDCVIMAVSQVMDSKKPDLILSGINHGSNMADDITYSGTIAAAMEGALMGIRSIAISQVYKKPDPINFSSSKFYAASIIQKLIKIKLDKNVLININFPPVTSNKVNGIKITTQGKNCYEEPNIIERLDPRGNKYFWLGYRRDVSNQDSNADVTAINNNYISITPIKLDLTDQKTFLNLKNIFK